MTEEPTPFMDYWHAVDEAMLKLFAINTTDGGIEPDLIAAAQEEGRRRSISRSGWEKNTASKSSPMESLPGAPMTGTYHLKEAQRQFTQNIAASSAEFHTHRLYNALGKAGLIASGLATAMDIGEVNACTILAACLQTVYTRFFPFRTTLNLTHHAALLRDE